VREAEARTAERWAEDFFFADGVADTARGMVVSPAKHKRHRHQGGHAKNRS